jgi:hypothetical protein
VTWRVTLGSCSLGSDDLAARQAEWMALDVHRVAAGTTPDGFVLRYAAAPGVVGDLRRLAAAEGGCCGFADWDVVPGKAEVVLSVTGPEPGIDELRHAFGVPTSAIGEAGDHR